MTNQYVEYVCGLCPDDRVNEVVYWVNHNLRNYINKRIKQGKKVPSVGKVEHILDYLMSDKAPKRLQKMSFKEAKQNAKKWNKALMKKGNKVVETELDIETFLELDDGFRIVKLKSKDAYLREGNLMRHCVGSYHEREGSTIYSLRDSKNQPHATIEVVVDKDEIQQCKGKGNGEIHPRYIKYVLKFFDKIDMKVRDTELRYLGYVNIEPELPRAHEYIRRLFGDSAKFMSYGGNEYFYMHSNLKDVEEK